MDSDRRGERRGQSREPARSTDGGATIWLVSECLLPAALGKRASFGIEISLFAGFSDPHFGSFLFSNLRENATPDFRVNHAVLPPRDRATPGAIATDTAKG